MDRKKAFTLGVALFFFTWILYDISQRQETATEKPVKKGPQPAPSEAEQSPLQAVRQPFHSRNNSSVYHLCANCSSGRRISPKNRVPGTGDGELCKICDDLIQSGMC